VVEFTDEGNEFCFGRQSRAKSHQKEGLVLSAKKASDRVKIILFLAVFSVLSTAVSAGCCLNHLVPQIFCKDTSASNELNCCANFGAYGFGDYDSCVSEYWRSDVESCFELDECQEVCCISTTTQCQPEARTKCESGTDIEGYFKVNEGECSALTACQEGCCCRGTEEPILTTKPACDITPKSTYFRIANDCATICEIQQYIPCVSDCSGYTTQGCYCAGEQADAGKFCCAYSETETYIFGSQSACNSVSSLCAAKATYSVSGRVTSNSVSLQGATVNIGGKTATTSSDGTYTISELTARTYDASASKGNYTQKSQSITITDDDLYNINFDLPYEGYCGDWIIQTPNSARFNEECDPSNGITCVNCKLIEVECDNDKKCDLGETYKTCDDCPKPVICGDGTKEGWEECDEGPSGGATCLATCRLKTSNCITGTYNATGCTPEPVTLTFSDGPRTFECPRWEKCGINGYWTGVCEKINPKCPTACNGVVSPEPSTHNLGGVFCTTEKPFCKTETLSPDIATQPGKVCCQVTKAGDTADDVCAAKISLCEYRRCDAPNPVGCRCGTDTTAGRNVYCCSETGKVYSSSGQCYDQSVCKVNCLTGSSTHVVVNSSNYLPEGCDCGGLQTHSGVCCVDGTYLPGQDSSICAEHVVSYITIQGTVTNSKTGAKIQGAVVYVTGTVNIEGSDEFVFRSDETDSNGFYMIRNAPKPTTTYKITADKRGLYYSSSREIKAEDIEGILITEDFSLTPLPPLTVSGYVFDAEETADAGIEGAGVSVTDLSLQGTTDRNGKYTITQILMGMHLFQAQMAGYYSETKSLMVNDNIPNFNFSLTKSNCFLDKYADDTTMPNMKSYPFMSTRTRSPTILTADSAIHSISKLGITVKWTSACRANGFNIYRCDNTDGACTLSSGNWKLAGTASSTKTQFEDNLLQYDKTYCYKIGAEFSNPFYAEVFSSIVCNYSGDSECYLYGKEYCDGTKKVNCSTAMKKTETDYRAISENTTCGFNKNYNGKIGPVPKSNCSECNKPLGLFSKINWVVNYVLAAGGTTGTTKTLGCSDIPVCYEDYTNISVDKYYSCENVKSCYDYKSEGACTQSRINNVNFKYNNRCLQRNCTWEADYRYEELGFGVCRELTTDELCPGDRDCDKIADSADADDDNDMSYDIYDYDLKTGADILQDCSRCSSDKSRNPVYMKCDETRCGLYGECYFAGGECLNRKDIGCNVYTNQKDCEKTNNFSIDKTDNNATALSDDYFGFGVCEWDDENRICIKDVDAYNESVILGYSDCGIDNQNCWLDMAPAETSISLLGKYSPVTLDLGAMSFSVLDLFTDSYAGSDTYVCVEKQSKSGSCSAADNDNNGIADNYIFATNGIKKDTANASLQKVYRNFYFTSDWYRLNYYSKNKAATEDDSSDNLEHVKSVIFNYDSEPPRFVEDSYIQSMSGRSEEIENEPINRSYYSDSTISYWLQPYMIGKDEMRTDLFINFTLTEPALCKITLRKVGEQPTENLLINDENWTRKTYDSKYFISYKNLTDGAYYFDYECYDSVLNMLKENVLISIDSDQTMKIIWPEEGEVINNQGTITLQLLTKSNLHCAWTDDLSETIKQNAFDTAWTYRNNFTPPIPLPEKSDAGYLQTAHYDVKTGSKFFKVRVLCNTKLGIKDELFVFTVDATPPYVEYENPLEEFWQNKWYNGCYGKCYSESDRIGLRTVMRCIDPPIEGGTNAGCTELYYCIGADCSEPNAPTKSATYPGGERISITGDVFKDVCYYAVDNEGNKGTKECSIIKYDSVEPMLDGVVIPGLIGPDEPLEISGTVNDYLSDASLFARVFKNTDNDWVFSENIDGTDKPIFLDDFIFKANVTFGQTSAENKVELLRFRISYDDGSYYSLYADPYSDKISIARTGVQIAEQSYPLEPGQAYEFYLDVGSQTTNTAAIKVNVDGTEVLSITDNHFGDLAKGKLMIPRPAATTGTIKRNITAVRIGGYTSRIGGYTSGVSDVWYYDAEDNKVSLWNPKTNSLSGEIADIPEPLILYAADAAGNEVSKSFTVKKDIYGPDIYAKINNSKPETIGNLDRYSEYGTEIAVYISANDSKYSNEVNHVYCWIYNEAGEIERQIIPRYNNNNLSFIVTGLAVGNYTLNITAYDKYGNNNTYSQTFKVRDTTDPNFSISVDFQEDSGGFFNYTLRGYVYNVTITASEPLSDIPVLNYTWYNPARAMKEDSVIDITETGDMTYTGTLTIKYEPRYDNFTGIATFEIQARDVSGNSGTAIADGRTFNIDTRGAAPPKIHFPSTTAIIYTNQPTQYITGFEGELKSDVIIEMDVLDIPTNPKYQTSWNRTSITFTRAQGNEITTGTAEIAAAAGDRTITIIRNDLATAGNYIRFSGSNTSIGLYYRINSNTPAASFSTLELGMPLESNIAAGSGFTVYSAQYPQGWFGIDANLMIGYNYLYVFGYDEHGIKGEPAIQVQGRTTVNPWSLTVLYDPFEPQITPIKPYYPGERLVTPVKNSAVIAEIYEDLSMSQRLINMTVNYTDYTKVPAVTRAESYVCGPATENFSCSDPISSSLNMTYNYDERDLGAGLYVVTVNAADLAGNKASAEWEFEIDPNVPYPPMIYVIGGVNYKGKAYTRSRNPVVNITFVNDGEKNVNITSISLKGQYLQETDVLPNITRVPNTNNSFMLNLGGLELTDGEYNLTLHAIKQINETDWSNEGGPYLLNFIVDNTPPKINVDITTPTMIKNPNMVITTDDPSNCSYHTEQYTTERYMPDIEQQFSSRLEKHSLQMKQLSGVKYSKTQHMMHVLGDHTATVRCENILGRPNSTEKEFKLIFPNMDKVFYKKGDTMYITLKLDETRLTVTGNFSSISSSNQPDITATASGTTYTLTYTLPTNLRIESGQYEIPITIAGVDTTSVLIYYHNGTWTFEDDVQSAVSCYNSNNPGVYFGEVYCDPSADISLSLKLSKGLGTEQSCADNIDNDGDSLKDCADSDCGGIRYECRNTQRIVSAVNISDPRNVKKLSLAGGTTVFYTSSVKPGQTFRARFLQDNIQQKSSQFAVKLIPSEWGVTQSNANIVDLNNILDMLAYSGDQVQAGPATYTGNLNLLIEFPVGQTENPYTLEFVRSVDDAAGVAYIQSEMSISSSAISEEKDYISSDYYGCYDMIDNDLDSADWAWKNRNNNIETAAVGANGVDCWDPACDNQKATATANCEYQHERTCNDNFDNDLDDDNGQPDYVATGGIDCRDIDCNTKQGGASANLLCEYRKETSCSDGFNNDAYQQKDCDLIATSDTAGLQEAYDAAEYDCAESCRQSTEITKETGQLCNDNKDNDYDYFTATADDKSQYLIGARNTAGGIDCRYVNPDTDCNGQTFTDDSGRTGECQLGNEISCNDGFDNDQDGNINAAAGWTEADYNNYFGEGKYTKGADCDDYSCAGPDKGCPTNEMQYNGVQHPEWCFDNTDNDLDALNGCLDPDCNGVEYNGKKCEFGKELSCKDGFDNDGDGLTDQYDPDCRAGVCYPMPAEENITIDSCSDSFDQDFSEGTDCSDPDCDGKPCGAASKCMNGVCKSVIAEVCNDNIDNDYDGLYDCYDDDCYGKTGCTTQLAAGMCSSQTDYDADGDIGCSDSDCENSIVCKGGETAQFTTAKTGIKVTYNKYVRIGEKLRVRFEKLGLSNTALLLAVGDETNPISSVTIPTTSSYTSVGAGFTKAVNDNGVAAQNTAFTGNLDTYIEITVSKAMFETKTLGYNIQAGADIDSGTIQIFVSESTKPVLPTTYTLEKVKDGFRFQVEPTDGTAASKTGIDRCEFVKNRITTSKIITDDCSYIYQALSNTDKINVTAYDRAGNYIERVYPSTTLAVPSRFAASYSASEYNNPGDNLEFSARFEGVTSGTCTATITDSENNAVKTQTGIPISSAGVCAGTIDISGLENASYSMQVQTGSGASLVKTEYTQFFKCRNTYFPSSYSRLSLTGQHCMDSCQVNRPLPHINITKPLEGEIFSYPRMDVSGTTNESTIVDIFVNTLDRSQQQVRIGTGQNIFNAKAMAISSGNNTITARVTDEAGLVNFDNVTIYYTGKDVQTNVKVHGLPSNIKAIEITMIPLSKTDTIDIDGTEINFYKENIDGDEAITLDRENILPNIINATNNTYTYREGTYRVEIVPKLATGWGTGKVYRFSYCPYGSQVTYQLQPPEKTNNKSFTVEGTIKPKPDRAELIIVNPSGMEIPKTITVDSAGAFKINVTNAITSEGQYSYYIRTTLGKETCEDVQMALNYDKSFKGTGKPYIVGEEYKLNS
jgi:hypothetical protein